MKAQCSLQTLQDNAEAEQPPEHKPAQSAWPPQQWLVSDTCMHSQGDAVLLESR